jgi:hypothetical protein
MKSTYGEQLTIEIVTGGFILTYPVVIIVEGNETTEISREVFSSPRKLQQKIKDVIAQMGTVAED